jgi:hypothetical protein
VFVAIGDNHQGYADVIAGTIGSSAPGLRDETLHEELVGAFEGGDVQSAASAAYDLESRLVATQTALLARLTGIDGAKVIASIVAVEARQCTVLADLAGGGDDFDALFENEAEPLAVTGEPEADR